MSAGKASEEGQAQKRPRVYQTIVVEGRDDMSAVLAAVDANVLWTHGYGITQNTLDMIAAAYEKTGIVIFTDPDHAGRQIRERLTKLFPEALQAYLTQDQAERSGDIGIENARPEDILRALKAAGCENGGSPKAHTQFNMNDMVDLGLTGAEGSAEKRARAGAVLGIGTANAGAYLKRLNHLGISREDIAAALERAETKE